jgi:translocation and assembly module TamB
MADDRLRWGRGLAVGLSILGGLVLIATIAVFVLTGTDWGHERVRRIAQSALGGMVNGKVKIGTVSGNLLTGITVHDVAITDSSGAPFVAVESFKGNYSIMSLLRKHIWIQDAVLVRPLIVLDRPPNGEWNYQKIFKRDTTPQPPNQPPSWGDWIRFSNAKVVDGQLIVRTPWKPSQGLSAAARDSAIDEAVSGKSRLVIQQVPGGFQKTVQLDSVSGTFPLVRLAEPGMKSRLVEVSTLAMDAYPFRPPGAEVRDLKGAFAFDNDSAWWKGAYVALPQSKATGDGVYELSSGDLRMTIHSDPVSFADMRWIYPALPSNGRGSLDFEMVWKGAVQDYFAPKADLTIGDARITGSAGATLGDTLTIHDTDLRFSGIDTRLLEQVIPHFTSPRRGVLAGHGTVSGGRNALVLNADVTFDDQRAGRSRLMAVGEVGMFPGGIRARDLRLQMQPIQVAMARTWMPSLPIAGTVTGSATVNGSTTTQLAVAGRFDHNDRGAHSAFDGKGTIRLSGGKYFDLDVNANPVSLVEVGRFAPAAGLQGTAAGPLHLTGALKDLRVSADLRLPEGGRFTTRGTLDLASKEKGYDLVSSLYTVNLRTVNSKAPVTSLTANAAVRGRGFALATMNTAIAADFSASRLDTIAVDTVSVRASAANGVANVEKLYVLGSHVAANVHGTLGLVNEKSGTISYAVAVDSLGALNRFIPRTPGDTVAIPPRPGVVARALRKARADSARIAQRTEIQRLATGQPGPTLNVDLPSPVPADTLMGAVRAAGTLTGNITDFSLAGTANGDHIVARGNSIRAFNSYFRWDNVRTPAAKLAIGAEAGSVSAMGFALDTVSLRGTYAPTGGRIELVVGQGDSRQLSAFGDYALNTDRKELRVASFRFQFDTSLWMTPHSAAIRWGGPGVQVDSLELRNRGGGRIYANGLLPTEGIADFRLEVDSFPVGDVVSLAEADLEMTGIISVHGTMGGTTATPAFRGDFGLAKATYKGTPVPDLVGRFGYADRQLVAHVDATRKDTRPTDAQPMVVVDARVPINLALTGATGSRMLPDPISVDLVADSLPLELVPQFTDVVSNFHGRAFGRVAMRGTLKRPSLVGRLALMNGTVMLNSTGATFDHLNASIRMANDTVYVDSVAAKAIGDVHLRGSLAVGDWREPAFNLYLTSNGAELLNNDRGRIRVDAGIALTGPFTNAYLSGGGRVSQGVIYAPEPTGRHLVGAGDPELFNVLDTAITAERDLFPAASPLLKNLRVDMELSIKRNTWVRNREANVEIYTEDPIAVRAEQQAFALTGVVNTDRGEYNFLSKRFQIKRGSIMFIGSPDLNPTLQITGEYEVQATRTLNISVLIGGTLKRPKLSLESDAQPPKTQSELLSLLAFGQPTSSLLAFGSSSVAGSAATGDLFGTSAQFAAQRLASVAVGVAVDQIELQAGRAFGTDVLDITPGDVPVFKGGSRLGNFFSGTRIEAGKYINGRTFVGLQEQGGQPGASIEHRTADGWRFNASIAPRIILREPTLTQQPYRATRSYGGFIIREWRF